ncbi:MAG: hypothetical protein AB1351_02345 [Thermoproteota archaeon]
MTWKNLFSSGIKTLSTEKGVLYLSVGTIVSNVGGALLWILLTNILIVADYGRVEYFVAIASLLASVGLISMNTMLLTYLPKNVERVKSQSNLLVLINGLILAVGFFIFSNHFATTIFLFGQMLFTMSTSEILGRRRYKEYAIVIISYKILQIALSILLYYLLGVDGIIIGYGISSIVFSYRFFSAFRRIKFEFDELATRKQFVFFSFALSLAGTVNAVADKLVIAPLFGFTNLGFYQLGFQFSLFLGLIPNILFQYLLPNEAAGDKKSKLKQVGIILSLAITFTIFALAPIIVSNIFPKYVDAVDTVRIMILGAVPTVFSSVKLAKLLGEEKTLPVLLSSVIFAAFQIPLLVLLGNMFGTNGLALATVGGLSIQAGFLYLFDGKMKGKQSSLSIG